MAGRAGPSNIAALCAAKIAELAWFAHLNTMVVQVVQEYADRMKTSVPESWWEGRPGVHSGLFRQLQKLSGRQSLAVPCL